MWRRFSVLMVLLLAMSLPAFAAPSYSVNYLMPYSGNALNDAGQVAGYWLVGHDFHATFWSPDANLDLGTLGGPQSIATGINNRGALTGWSHIENEDFNLRRAFVYENGSMRALPTLGGKSSSGIAINDRGQVAGTATTYDGHEHAFLYDSGHMRDLGALDGVSSTASDMNNLGQVVGVSGDHAFLYADGLRDLGAGLAPYSIAAAVNDNTQVVGMIGPTYSDGHAFLWENGSLRDLGTLGERFSAAFDINNRGDVIGWTDVTGVDGRRAFFYADGRMRTIDSMLAASSQDWQFFMAFSINNEEQILAYGCSPGRCGMARLDPVPEPSALLMLAGGLALLCLRGRRRWLPLLLALPLAAHSQGAEDYVLTQLPRGAAAINDSGQVAGTWLNPGGAYHGFRWNRGVFTDIGTLGGSYSNATAISNNGFIAGVSATAGGDDHAFLYANGAMRDLGGLSGKGSAAVAVNDAGQVAGNAYNASGHRRAFLYADGTMRELGTLAGASDSIAFDMNAAGQVVGVSGEHGFLYSDAVMHDLGSMGGQTSIAFGINDNGQIVGSAATAQSAGRPYLVTDGVYRDLGTFGGRYSESYTGTSFAINNAGHVVGGTAESSVTMGAFFYDGTLRGLNLFPGLHLDRAFDVNARDQMLVEGCGPNACDVYLLSPLSAVPEPAAAGLWLAGLLLVAQRRWGRKAAPSLPPDPATCTQPLATRRRHWFSAASRRAGCRLRRRARPP